MGDRFSNPFSNVGSQRFAGRWGKPSFDPFEDRALTPAQMELLPYIEQVKQEREREGKSLQPLAKLFDLLSRGNYASASAAEEIVGALVGEEDTSLQEIGQALWEGLTGKRKTTYSDVISKYTDLEERKLLPGREGKFGGELDWADILGFAGDVVLDPLTYVGVGPSAAARSAAKSFARDATKLTARGMLRSVGTKGDDFAKVAKKGFDAKRFDELYETAGKDDALKYWARHADDEASRRLRDTYQESYKHALRTPAQELRKEMRERANRQWDAEADDLFKRPNIEQGVLDYEWIDVKLRPVEEILERLDDKAYTGAGQRAWRVFAQEFAGGERYPLMVRKWDEAVEKLKVSPAGSRFRDALYVTMNKGPVGALRKHLGMRNPYQKMLRAIEIEEGLDKFKTVYNDNAAVVHKLVNDYDEPTQHAVVQVFAEAEARYARDETTTLFDVLNDADFMKGLDVDAEQVGDLTREVHALTKGWFQEYQKWVSEGVVQHADEIVNYLPITWKQSALRRGKFKNFGSRTPGFSMSRENTMRSAANQEIQKLVWAMGISREAAEKLVWKDNVSALQTNLEELLFARAHAQAKVAKRASLVSAFREFGVEVAEVNRYVRTALNRTGANLEEMGLRRVSDESLKGYLFDEDTFEIIERATASTNPENYNMFSRAVKWFTMWWKGVVTMTTGFHMRNAMSNEMMGFLKYGPSFNVDVREKGRALAGVIYALRKSDPKALLKETNMSEGMYQRFLNERIGGKTVKELADEARNRGVISEAQMGFSAQDIAEKVREKSSPNPFSLRFAPRRWSYKLGSHVENAPRFQSFLREYSTLADGNYKEAVEYATREAKQLFLDYEDLTDFEKGVMKNVIPFYTWVRKNLANQIHMLFTYPEMYAQVPKFEEMVRIDDHEFDPEVLPDYMRELHVIPTREQEPGVWAMFFPDLPHQDWNMVPFQFEEEGLWPALSGREVANDIVNATHPLMKLAASMATEKGYDFFYERELEEKSDAPYLMRLFASHPKTIELTDGLLRTLGKEDGLEANIDDNGKLQIDSKLAQALETFLPFLRQLNYLVYGAEEVSERLGVGFEEALEEFTHADDELEGVKQSFKVLSHYAGVKYFPLEEEEAEDWARRSIYYEASRRRRENLPGREVRSREYEDRLSRTIRKLGL